MKFWTLMLCALTLCTSSIVKAEGEASPTGDAATADAPAHVAKKHAHKNKKSAKKHKRAKKEKKAAEPVAAPDPAPSAAPAEPEVPAEGAN